jgi:hypothetical protein
MVAPEQREKMINAVTAVIQSTAVRIDLADHRLPSPNEFAVDIVDFFYTLAQEDTSADVQEKK